MSLSGALNNALSGLTANARAAGLVSSNIANATTEGYGRRTLGLAPSAVGTTGGVRITGVTRHSNPLVLGDRWLSDAALGNSETRLAFARGMETAIGQPGDAGSLPGRVTAFENSLTLAASNPASQHRLDAVAAAATDLAATLNRLSNHVQQARADADKAIAAQVGTLNETLARIDKLNAKIVAASSRSDDTAALMDDRQRALDTLSEIVPLRVVARDHGAIAVFSTGGAQLLDGSPARIGFQPASAIDASTILGAGLSGLTINGMAVNSGPDGPFGGGALGAQLHLRDIDGIARQAELDGLSRDLAERFGPGGPDPTMTATDPGLFTDAGTAFNAANEPGLAGRIALNTLVAPGTGQSWKLRDGLGAATPGDAGQSQLLDALGQRLTEPLPPGSTALAAVSRGFADRAADLSATVSGARLRIEQTRGYDAAQNTALREIELSDGVDTDAELQTLMRIEQQYAANAQVMSVVDDLMQRLLNAF
ncbi:flagellar hook-associated protein FlgK [Thalassococcus sp. CAU 1522]|uniref:Flagellar hook-associated protein 1 n=1 Tax=Thalassococcus arenae TaxID=2851652 RepID=A0ABS6N6X1_9RHOB|nr:flagellar basal body rod C-terminal domain-containing protein [Thalassococcus arenae]MBV2359349.1 flagellar hook-associated protein FlgK [Thalassococcus arenae]